MSDTALNLESYAIATDRYDLWGVTVNNYKLNGVKTDFEGIVIALSTGRAVVIEDEIGPLSTQIERRNEKLEEYGEVLARLGNLQAKFKSEDDGSKTAAQAGGGDVLTQDDITLLSSLGVENLSTPSEITKAQTEQSVQVLKTKIDKLNNDSQTDLTRLQTLVDKRDESFSTASSLMSSVSDTRGNAIKGIA